MLLAKLAGGGLLVAALLLPWSAMPGAEPSAKPAAKRAVSPASPPSAAAPLETVLAEAWAAVGVEPLPPCDDPTFLRRVWLDLAGRTPPLADAALLAQGKPLDRAAVVEKLLNSTDYARHWGQLWTQYLLDRRPFDGENYNPRMLQRHLRDALQQNTPYDQLVSQLILGEGTSDVSGPANFLLRYEVEPGVLAGAVSQKFLGLSLQCAECHDHPHASWKQSDFWGLAAYFARLRRMQPTNPQAEEDFSVVIERPRGELLVVDKKAEPDEQGEYPMRTVYPKLPGELDAEETPSRRQSLLSWMTDPANPFFARHAVNQVWERLLGAKLVDNFDRWPAGVESHQSSILESLQREFVASNFDLKQLTATIVLSPAYQCTVARSDADATAPADQEHEREVWARARMRPLSADQIHLSLAQAFGYYHDENDHRLAELNGDDSTYDLPYQSFGEAPASLRRSLALFNGDHARGAAQLASEATIRVHGNSAGYPHLERLCLSLLGRKPNAHDRQLLSDLAAASKPQVGLEDVAWVLLNSAEFNTNH